MVLGAPLLLVARAEAHCDTHTHTHTHTQIHTQTYIYTCISSSLNDLRRTIACLSAEEDTQHFRQTTAFRPLRCVPVETQNCEVWGKSI